MIIYRIETATGRGPFYTGAASDYAGRSVLTQSPYRHPGPWNDGIRDHDIEHYCGCKSLDQMRSWFPDRAAAEICLAPEHYLTVYEIPDENDNILFGGHQVMFRRDRARKVDRQLIGALYNE